MISVMTDLPDKLRTDSDSNWYDSQPHCHSSNTISESDVNSAIEEAHPSRPITTSSVQLDNYAVDNTIIRCVDDGPSDDRADKVSTSTHHQANGRRCKGKTSATSDFAGTTKANTVATTGRDVVTIGGNSPTNSTPISNDGTFSISQPISTDSEINDTSQAIHLVRSKYDDIVQSLPSDYEKTLQVVQDYLTDDQICGVLTSSNYTAANKTILNCLMEKIKCTADILEFCDQLEKITSLLPNPGPIVSVVNELNAAYLSPVVEGGSLPQKISLNEDFNHLKRHYHTILQLMPGNYEESVGKLQNYISDDQICMVLSSNNSTTANKKILDCLIERMNCREELLDLCDQLETISTSHQLMVVISEIKSESLRDPCLPIPSAKSHVSTSNTVINLPSEFHHPATETSNSTGRTESATEVTRSQSRQGDMPSIVNLQEQLKYDFKRTEIGIKCPTPPPLPPNYVCRQHLLDQLLTKLNGSTIEPDSYGTSVTVTGAGGFGKTSLVIALSHHPVIKDQFTDGVVFIELGPQSTDPSMKLKGMYNLLTDKQCDVNVVEQQINQLTSLYCRNLLVIIDDVWHVEDAEPIVKAFSKCKIVLTTRMNDIERYIATKHIVNVGQMEQSEALSLLTGGVIDVSKLSQEDMNSLDELAKDVDMWPLLLSLIRGQLRHHHKRFHLKYHDAIRQMQTKLCDKGLTAFDKNNIERSRKHAVKACIEVTLELLTEDLSDKVKSVILWTGIGTSIQTALLHTLWDITENEAKDTIDMLWAYGLFQFTDIRIPPNNNIQCCVEVHTVISRYIMESMDSTEVFTLSPVMGLCTYKSICNEATLMFQKCYGMSDNAVLDGLDLLNYRQSQLEYDLLPFNLKLINMLALLDPHTIIVILRSLQNFLKKSANISALLPTINQEINSLINDCVKLVLVNAHKTCRELNQSIQRYLTQRAYTDLVRTLQNYSSNDPVGLIAQQAANVVKKVMLYCEGDSVHDMTKKYEWLNMMTNDYSTNSLMTVPTIQLLIKELQDISNSLLAGSPHTEMIVRHIKSGKYNEEREMSETNYYLKLLEVAPNYVHQQVLKQQHSS